MNLEARIKKLEGRKTKKQLVELLLPDWLAPSPIFLESEHFGNADVKPEIPEYIKGVLS